MNGLNAERKREEKIECWKKGSKEGKRIEGWRKKGKKDGKKEISVERWMPNENLVEREQELSKGKERMNWMLKEGKESKRERMNLVMNELILER